MMAVIIFIVLLSVLERDTHGRITNRAMSEESANQLVKLPTNDNRRSLKAGRKSY
jgi:hypothetical protein